MFKHVPISQKLAIVSPGHTPTSDAGLDGEVGEMAKTLSYLRVTLRSHMCCILSPRVLDVLTNIVYRTNSYAEKNSSCIILFLLYKL